MPSSSSPGSSGIPFYAFHDRDLASHGKSLKDANAQLDAVGRELKAAARYRHQVAVGHGPEFRSSATCTGAATSCSADVFAFAAAQVKKALEWTHRTRGEGYVFWGGRRDIPPRSTTPTKREMDHLARFHMAVAYKRRSDSGTLLD